MNIFQYHSTQVPNAIIFILFTVILASCGSYHTISSADGNQSDDRIQSAKANKQELASMSYVDLSTNFVYRVMHDQPVRKHLQLLKSVDANTLEDSLDTPQKRLTFWINIYNGYTQYFLKNDPSLYKKDRNKYFGKDQIHIAGYTVSFEDIEHGILRKGATIWTKGAFRTRLFRSKFIRRYMLDTVDFRIHFALNCGAKSCPPVVAYQVQSISKQLHKNTAYYLEKEAEYNKQGQKVKVPAFMKWFSADFGGNNGKISILKQFDIIPKDSSPDISYLNYDWTMKVENYRSY